MRTIGATLICLLLVLTGASFAQTDTDKCHVYVIDVEATKRFREKTDLDAFMAKSKQEQEAIIKASGAGKTYEEFAPKLGEEELTTRTFPFPKGKHIITASVFYTDESMGSSHGQDSMLLAISVDVKAATDALSAPDAAIVEITYNDDTDTVRVKKNIMIDGRLYVVGMECSCKNPESKEKN
jgi:hypothetical protein